MNASSLSAKDRWQQRFASVQLSQFLLFLLIFLGAVLLCTAFLKMHVVDGYASPVFVLAVFLISRYTDGYVYGLLAALLGVVSVNYFFTFPYQEFNVTLYGYPLTFCVFLTVAIATSALTTKAKQWDNIRMENERERMHADLLRSLSHDIRTPLTSILGASSAILEEPAMPKEQRTELVTDIYNESQDLLRIVENLLSITRIRGDSPSLAIVPWDIAEVIGEAVSKFRKRYPDIPVTTALPASILYVPMEPLLISQVMGNLMENAVRHGETTSAIAISVTERPESHSLEIAVQDDGQGFADPSPENAVDHRLRPPKAFAGKDRRVDRTRDMGIGLSVCATILRAHHGTLRTENNKTGACVRFTLPLSAEEVV